MSGSASPKGWGRRRAVFTGNVQGVGFRYRTLHVAHAFAAEPGQQPLDERRVAQRHGGLRNQTRQRIEPGTETGGQNQGGQHGTA